MQNRIANILGTYDDLIENNRRRMELLEESRGDFTSNGLCTCAAGFEQTRIINGVPNGWGRKCLGTITSKIGSGATPRGGEESYLTEGVPLIRSLNVYDDRFQDEGIGVSER